MVSFKKVKSTCTEGRFFRYDNWRDKVFVPPSIWLVWVFVNLGWSGNAVSWLSGVISLLGGVLMASSDDRLVLLGSFAYVAFYLLDYVDGGVSRFRKTSGITGQYVDWIMHVITAISVYSGISVGALRQSGDYRLVIFIIPFIVATALQLDRFSLGWWTICMYRQQAQSKDAHLSPLSAGNEPNILKRHNFLFKALKGFSMRLFHENYAFIILPSLALAQCFLSARIENHFFDFRIVFVILGGALYFPFVVYEITKLSDLKSLERSYDKLFFSLGKPDLPREHFFIEKRST